MRRSDAPKMPTRRKGDAGVSPLAPAPPKPGRRRRNLPPEEWRERILEAARQLLAEEGYEALTMDEVARVAGISRARLYGIYSNRAEMLTDVVTQDARMLAGEVLLELSTVPDLDEKVQAIVEVFFRFVERRRQRYRLLYSDAAAADPELHELLRSVRTALAETLSQHVLRVAPDLDPEEATLMSHAVISMAEGAAAWHSADQELERERAVRVVTALALSALGITESTA
jgi:AcrR family transcriptional regulator